MRNIWIIWETAEEEAFGFQEVSVVKSICSNYKKARQELKSWEIDAKQNENLDYSYHITKEKLL